MSGVVHSHFDSRRLWTIGGVSVHVLLLSVAAALYPGGTYWDKASPGFSAENFWCDLLALRAHDGGDNTLGSWLARCALVSVAAVFPLLAGVLADERLSSRLAQRAFRMLSVLGSLGLAIVALTTGVLDRRFHDWAILLLGPCGLLSLIWGIALGFRTRAVLVWLTGSSLVIFASWNLIQYARQTLGQGADWAGLPLVQKFATASLLAWMVAVSLTPPRASPARS